MMEKVWNKLKTHATKKNTIIAVTLLLLSSAFLLSRTDVGLVVAKLTPAPAPIEAKIPDFSGRVVSMVTFNKPKVEYGVILRDDVSGSYVKTNIMVVETPFGSRQYYQKDGQWVLTSF